jgi:hypothetical protein
MRRRRRARSWGVSPGRKVSEVVNVEGSSSADRGGGSSVTSSSSADLVAAKTDSSDVAGGN